MSIIPGTKITSIMVSAANGDTYGDAERKLFRGIQTLVMPTVINATTNTPPGAPASGDTYIVGSTPTGAWAGHANALAYWAIDPQDGVATTGIWEFYPATGTPPPGWTVYNNATGSYVSWSGVSSAWVPPVVVPNKTTISPATGAIVFNAALGNSFAAVMTGNVSFTITNPTDGQVIQVLWIQNATGGWTVTYPSNVHSIGFVGGAGTVSAVDLKLLTADQYVVLGGSGVSSAATTTISGGNVGSFPTNSITGTFTYTPPAAQVVAISQNQTDLSAAQVYYAGLTPTQSVTTADLGTQSGGGAPTGHYFPGVYNSGSTISISTPIVLDAQGNPNALFVFQAGSAITQAGAGTVTLANGAQASNVVWVNGSSYTSSGSLVAIGNILAQASITLSGGTLTGRALAQTGSVTIAAAMAISVPAAVPAGAFHAQPSPNANSVSSQSFTYNAATSTWYQTALGTYGL
jgi:hypothetical protein